ncbi:hypothetical protein GCM10025857_13040 [Alicyclobacillus contaminans]|uniref:SPW repeat protein n=1 Tax=Alicyclobacillus contaminans TaxID=392016 RepID=UPI00041D105F|nr:SPW repeat protein [Alicyclobacillus contaminans]GMA49947.1 hypothetical protein GCM10025857_13040 [Alicyclobacillus contaminans]
MKWRNWINALIGIWFILAPWLLGFSHLSGATWTSVVIGLVQTAASIWAAYEEKVGWATWQNWVSLITGLWFIIQPFALSLTANGAETWTGVILGIVTIILNLWTMAEGKDSSGRRVSSGRANTSA